MKKPLVVVIVVVAVLAASFLWIRSKMGTTDPATLVPSDAVAYVAFPDLPRSVFRWPRTTLAKIGAEGSVKAFLEKPMAHVAGERGGNDAAGVLTSLKPGRVFGAVLSLEAERVTALVGFQFWGSGGDFDSAMARLRQTLHAGNVPEVLEESHHGTTIASTPLGDRSLLTASQGQWGFLSNDRDTLVAALDRAAGRRTDASLAEDSDFLEVSARLPKDPDTMVFVRPGPVLDTLLAVGSGLGAIPDERQIAPLRKAKAAGFAAKLDGTNILDALFVLAPPPPHAPVLEHHGMRFTSPETLGYFASVLHLEEMAAMAAPGQSQLAAPDAFAGLFARLPMALGNEICVSFSWPQGGMRPGVLASAPVRDPDAALALLMDAAALAPETTISEKDGFRFFSFPSLRSAFLDPVIALGPGTILAGLDPVGVGEAIARAPSGQTLLESPPFAPALRPFQTANESFGFLDAKGIFERTYPMLKQVVVFGAALVPGISDIMDASKLPETESIAKHLTPILYSQTRLPNGILIESSGPISMNQAILATAAIATAIQIQRGQDQ
jgi:hypothetical protein